MVQLAHGDHWLAALDQADPRLRDVLSFPMDVRDAVALHRRPITDSVDLVQVTAKRRLLTAYPEPRATALVELKPRELLLWDTRVEGWLVGENEGAGALTVFLTDLVERAADYQAAKGMLALEVGGLAYTIDRLRTAAPSRLLPAGKDDARFLADDYHFQADVLAVHPAVDGSCVLDLGFQNGLVAPIVTRADIGWKAGDRAQGYAWLTARLPQGL